MSDCTVSFKTYRNTTTAALSNCKLLDAVVVAFLQVLDIRVSIYEMLHWLQSIQVQKGIPVEIASYGSFLLLLSVFCLGFKRLGCLLSIYIQINSNGSGFSYGLYICCTLQLVIVFSLLPSTCLEVGCFSFHSNLTYQMSP